MRKLKVVGAVVLISLFLGSGAGYLYLRSALPPQEGVWVVDGVDDQVEIWRDSLGIPHIWASSEEDLYLAVGYIHAQDRLWQMDLFRHLAEGRLSELFGERLLDTDRFLRTIGLGRAARESAVHLDEDGRKSLEAYVAGVNAALENRRGALPPEFVILRHEPEPWEIEHSLMLEKIMAWDLSTYQSDLSLTRAFQLLGPERGTYLVPDLPEWYTDILGSDTTLMTLSLPEPVPDAAATLLESLSITRASNSWVISGEKTSSGRPILANDMHLALAAPSLWYLAALHAGELEVVGMTLPGAPFVISGHNRAIAWGLTNAYLDDLDLFIERRDPEDATHYLTPEGSEPFEILREEIVVRGRAEPVIHEALRTRNGPVLLTEEGNGDLLSLRWVGHEPASTWRGLAKINRASNWEEFLEGVSQFDNPHQNLIYADTSGQIGYKMGGRVPIRGDYQRPPRLPVPAWSGEWDWKGFLPFAEHPELLDPPEGGIITANNRQVAGPLADLISSWWDESFRAERIAELLSTGEPFDTGAVRRQQLDQLDTKARRYRHLAISAAENVGLDEVAARIREWDLRADLDSRAAALYYTWEERLRGHIAVSLYEGTGGGYGSHWFPREALTAILERRALPWVEGEGTTEFEELSRRSALEADSIVGLRTLGELQFVLADHPLGDLPIIGKLFGFNVGPAPFGGSPTTVNVAGRGPGGWVEYGASQRYLVDLADPDRSGRFIIPTGQSGIPLSGAYHNQFELWLEGELWPIPLDREEARAGRVTEMILIPGEPGRDP